MIKFEKFASSQAGLCLGFYLHRKGLTSTIYFMNVYLNVQAFHHSGHVHHVLIKHVCLGEYFPCPIFGVIPMKFI